MSKTTAATFDLSNLDTVARANQGAEFELKHPGDERALGMFISVYGSDSDIFREVVNDRVHNDIAQRTNDAKRGRETPIKSTSQRKAEQIELLCACTTGWRGMVEAGHEIPFTLANVKRVYEKYPWIVSQVDDAIGDVKLFLKTS